MNHELVNRGDRLAGTVRAHIPNVAGPQRCVLFYIKDDQLERRIKHYILLIQVAEKLETVKD
jgi:hypothetical protein